MAGSHHREKRRARAARHTRDRMSAGGLSFYREVLRSVRKLPRDSQSYYRVVAREKFAAHREEEDPERISLILERSRADLAWILAKYSAGGVAAGRR